jgi:hypothetical protein
MARRIARLAGDHLVLIPLTKTTFSYFPDINRDPGIEAFHLAAMLRRAGASVAFVCTDPQIVSAAKSSNRLALRFEPHADNWLLTGVAEEPPLAPPRSRAVLAGAGIRGFSRILPKLDHPLKIQSLYVMDPSYGVPGASILDPSRLPIAVTLTLTQIHNDYPTAPAVFSTRLVNSDLGECLHMVLGGCSQGAYDRAKALVARHHLNEAHICDHPFFESAMIAHAVKANGGRVILWPHACAAAWPPLKRSGEVDEINCAVRSSAAKWQKQLPATTVHVRSDLWLRPNVLPRPATPAEPVHVAVIGTDPVCGHFFAANRDRFEDAHRRLFRGLATLRPDVRYVCKPHSEQHLRRLWDCAEHSPDFVYTGSHPTQIELPNLIFLFPIQFSSAVFEGLGRGIPALLLTIDDGTDQYLNCGIPDCIPSGDVDVIVAAIPHTATPWHGGNWIGTPRRRRSP